MRCTTSQYNTILHDSRQCSALQNNEFFLPHETSQSTILSRCFPGIREICDAEKALGIQWTKTSAGHYSKTPCPRGAKGLSSLFEDKLCQQKLKLRCSFAKIFKSCFSFVPATRSHFFRA